MKKNEVWTKNIADMLDELDQLIAKRGVLRGKKADAWIKSLRGIQNDPDADDFLQKHCKGACTMLWNYSNGNRSRKGKDKDKDKIKGNKIEQLKNIRGTMNAITQHIEEMSEAA